MSGDLVFERWVPNAARSVIVELKALRSLTPADHAIVDRLAHHPSMRTDVWARLPPEPAGVEGTIIELTLMAARMALMQRPPFPARGKKAREAYLLKKYPQPLTPDNAEGFARWLIQSLNEISGEMRDLWEQVWPGDRSLTFESIIGIVGDIRMACERLAAMRAAQVATLSIPTIRKRRSPAAPRIFFSRFISGELQKLYGRPLDEVVASLELVVFDQADAVGSSTIRGRRRSLRGHITAKK
jgi:hypothetical protein